MSKSPKYTLARARTDVRSALRREREDRERRRAERLAGQRAAAMDAARGSVRGRYDRVAAAVAALPDPGTLRQRVGEVERAITAATGQDELLAAARDLAGVEADQVRLAAASAAADGLLAVYRLLATVPDADRERFDPGGAAEVRDLVNALRAGDAAPDHVLRHVGDHLRRVLLAKSEHDRDAAVAGAAATAAQVRLTLLAEDATAAGVDFDRELADGAVQLVRSMVEDGELTDALALSTRLAARLDQLEVDLDASIDRITQRRQMLASIVDVLPRLGLSVERDSLTETADGAVGIRASRYSGDQLAVVVQEAEGGAHRIFYLSSAMAGAQARGGNAQVRGCATLAEFAEQVNASVRAVGYEAGAVDWDGRAGQQLPPSGGPTLAPSRNRSGWQTRGVAQ
jgi:hypothetical protein